MAQSDKIKAKDIREIVLRETRFEQSPVDIMEDFIQPFDLYRKAQDYKKCTRILLVYLGCLTDVIYKLEDKIEK